MKITYLCSVVICLLSCFFSFGQVTHKLTLENPLSITRPDELVVLQRKDLEKRWGPINSTFTVKAGGKLLPVQFDDLTSDGKWDEAVFLYSFKPKEKLGLNVTLQDVSADPAIQQKAHVRLRKRIGESSWGPNLVIDTMPLKHQPTDFGKQPLPLYLTEGPAWENDKVGFRLYFDLRNGKDIWGKLTPRMVLDSVGTHTKFSYHDYASWGMDLLKVGKSLGAGSLAILLPRNGMKDTLVRLGGQDVHRTVYRQISDGPVRASFEMQYDLQLLGNAVKVIEQISIWGGQYFYESTTTVSGAPQGAKLVSGIVNLHENSSRAFPVGGTQVVLSHGPQSENKDQLGMALLVPSSTFAFAGTAPNVNSDIINTYLVAQSIDQANPCVFRFIAAWEKTNQLFSELEGFEKFVSDEASKMSSRIAVRL